MAKFVDLTGKTINRWYILRRYSKNSKSRGALWECQCKCGNKSILTSYCVKRSKSCGCYLKEVMSKRAFKLDFKNGSRFGILTVIKRTDIKSRLGVIWNCKCDCGNEINVVGNWLINPKRLGKIKSCGCNYINSNFIDLTGKRFNRLLVIKKSHRGGKDKNTYWLCNCDCGNEITAATRHLNYGSIQSCGCYKTNMTSIACSTDDHKLHLKNLAMIKSMKADDKKQNEL